MSDPTSAEAGSARLAKALNTYATNRTDRTASTSSSDDTSNHLLYTPSLFSSSFDAKPKNLLAADVPTTYGTHPSSEIYEALASHSRKMTEIEKELIALSSNPDAQKGDTTFNGHTGAEVAQALADYAKSHPGEGLPSDFEGEQEGLSQAAKLHNLLAAGVGASAGTGTVLAAADGTADSAFSFASLLQSLSWARTIYAIVWIVLGLFLVFFGWSALNWLNRPRARSSSKGEKSSSKKSRPAAPWLGAGIGGAVIGFLFFSYLASILTCIISTRSKDLSATAFFAVWLASGALGAVVGGRWKVAGWTMAGLAAGPCLTLIVTAMFGIHTLLIRIILVVVFTMLLTAPLLVPRHPAVHRLLLISCTSIVGIVTFLDGVALFAPPEDSSASWLDLWVVFFAADDSASETAAMKKWGSSAFKGYIAGAVLGAVIGSVFEAILHKHAGEDPEAEWNDYLGTYTERFENGTFPGAYDRAGMFEPTPSPWRKIANLFANARTPSPASYGNLPGGGRERSSSPLTERSGGMGAARRARSTRSARSGRTARGAPARFEALSKRDKDLEEGGSDSESDATEFDSDDEDGGAPKAKMIGMDDGTPALATLGRRPQMENYGGYALPKPPILSPAPSYTTAAPISSTLSGSTAKGSDAGASSPIAEVEKALAVYRDGDAATERATSPAVDQKVPMANIDEKAELRSTSSPPPASASANASANAQAPASPGARMVPATPSLINAISRIQQAQEQTRAWHASQPPAAYSAAAADAAEGPDSRPTSPPVGAAGASAAGFDKWWKKEVGERS